MGCTVTSDNIVSKKQTDYFDYKSTPKIFFSGKFMTNVSTVNNTSWNYYSANNWVKNSYSFEDWEALIEFRKKVNNRTFNFWNAYGDGTFSLRDLKVTGV